MVKRLQLVVSWKAATAGDVGAVDFLEHPAALRQGRDQRRDDRAALPVPAAEDMTPDDAKKASGNVAGLCIWARAMVLYVDIAKVVKPKMAALKVAEGKLKSANGQAGQGAGRARRRARPSSTRCRPSSTRRWPRSRRSRPTPTRRKRMDAANKLIGGLGGERTRWMGRLGGVRRRDPPAGGRRGARVRLHGLRGPLQRRLPQLLLRERF